MPHSSVFRRIWRIASLFAPMSVVRLDVFNHAAMTAAIPRGWKR